MSLDGCCLQCVQRSDELVLFRTFLIPEFRNEESIGFEFRCREPLPLFFGFCFFFSFLLEQARKQRSELQRTRQAGPGCPLAELRLESLASAGCCSGQGNTSQGLGEAKRRYKCSVRTVRGHQHSWFAQVSQTELNKVFWETSSYHTTLHFCHGGASVLSVFQTQRSGGITGLKPTTDSLCFYFL